MYEIQCYVFSLWRQTSVLWRHLSWSTLSFLLFLNGSFFSLPWLIWPFFLAVQDWFLLSDHNCIQSLSLMVGSLWVRATSCNAKILYIGDLWLMSWRSRVHKTVNWGMSEVCGFCGSRRFFVRFFGFCWIFDGFYRNFERFFGSLDPSDTPQWIPQFLRSWIRNRITLFVEDWQLHFNLPQRKVKRVYFTRTV